MFTIQEADYSFLFQQEPSFPRSHFAMIADTQRLQAYAGALRKALDRAAAGKQRQQQGLHAAAAVASASGAQQAHGAGSSIIGTDGSGLTVLDLGCGSGVLSLLAAAALAVPMHGHPAPACEPSAPAETAAALESNTVEQLAARSADSQQLPTAVTDQQPPGSTAAVATTGAAATKLSYQPKSSVIGVELAAPLAGVAQRAVAANGVAEVVSIVQADVGSCRRGQQVPIDGADVIVLDMFDSGNDVMSCI